MQAAAGLEQYIALDRPDIAYSVKTALQQMSKPTKLMKLRIIKVARYLKSNPRLVWRFQYQQQPKSIDVFVDADFAARETMLRSTSGVAEFFGKSPIEFGSSTQSVRALSTEFYATIKGSAHSLHSQAILKGFGVVVEAVVLSDASAGIGIASRQGCGRLKHLEVNWLWVQEKVSEKALSLRKHLTQSQHRRSCNEAHSMHSFSGHSESVRSDHAYGRSICLCVCVSFRVVNESECLDMCTSDLASAWNRDRISRQGCLDV